MSGDGEVAELRLAPETIEDLAVRIAGLLGGGSAEACLVEKISAAEVSRLWGVSRRWVYAHRDDLGALELGDGPRPRLRFDPRVVETRLGAPDGDPRPAPPPVRRRSTWINASRISDSLLPRSRATVSATERVVPGAARERPPDVAPNRGRRD
jgi:Troponin I residues 1-32